MKRFLFIIGLLAFAALPARATNSIAQSNGCADAAGTTSHPCTISLSVASGDLLIIGGLYGAIGNTLTVADNASGCTNTWTQLSISPVSDGVSGGEVAFMFWTINCGTQAGGLTVTITSSASHKAHWAVVEAHTTLTGWNATQPDVQNSASNATSGTSPWNSGALTPSASGNFMFVVWQVENTQGAGAASVTNCTELDAGGTAGNGFAGTHRAFGCYVLSTGTTSVTPALSVSGGGLSGGYSSIDAVFQPSGGAATPKMTPVVY